MNEVEPEAAQALTALGLTINATDEEVQAVARRLDPEAPQDAVEAIRIVIDAVRACHWPSKISI